MIQQLAHATRRGRRRGSALIWAALTMTTLIGFASLAVETGRVRSIKAEMQSCADATALSILGAYADGGMSAAYAAAATYSAANPVDRSSGIAPTITLEPGTWDAATRTFSTTYAPGTAAVRVTVSRTAANNNAVLLPLGSVIGMSRCDVRATAVGTLVENDSAGVTVPATSHLYLAGMPSGTGTSNGDNTSNAAPYGVGGIAVVPGTWITITVPAGTTSILPGTTPYVGPEGEAARPLHHGQNQNGADYGIGPENGIADAVIPGGALTGLFLTDGPPTDGPTPAPVDWTAGGRSDKDSYTDLTTKAPFMIGNGQTSGGTVQRFLVPPGATRLFLGVWDGVASYNNGGQITATVNLKRSIRLVK